MKIVKIILYMLVVGFIALPVAGYAAVYYVATTGNDSNPGTQSQPWLTIQHAADTVVAGDTVIVESGDYNERVELPSHKSGTADAKIVFKADPSRSVNMTGFVGDQNDYIVINGFNITYTGPAWHGGGVWVDGDHWEIVNNYFHDVTTAAINPTTLLDHSTDYLYIANNHMYKCNKGFVIRGNNCIAENNEAERLVRHSNYGEDADYSRFFGSNNIIRNNYFHGTRMDEIGNSHVDGFQTFENNGYTAKNIIIEGNVVEGPVHEIAMLTGADGSHDNIVFRNNIFTNSRSWGIDACGITSLKIYNNVFAYINHSGIGFSAARSGSGNPCTGEVKNNIFFNVYKEYWAHDGSIMDAEKNLLYKTDGTVDPNEYPNDIINQNPDFVAPAATNGDFHLRPGSPAIDHGVTITSFNTDKDGNSRPQGSGYDIGAYEYVDYADEDVNRDNYVNISDVQLVVNVILGNATNSRADVNGDGNYTVSDVQEVVNGIVN